MSGDSELGTRLRVAQVGTSIFPVPPVDHGGTERVVSDLSAALARLGVEVTLFAPSDSRADMPRIGRLPSLQALEREHGLVPPGVPAMLDAVRMSEVSGEIGRFDVVHCHCEFLHAPVLGAARAKSLTTIHWRADELDRRLFFEAFPDLKVAAISAAQEASIPQANRAGVVHHGIDVDRYAPGSGAGGYLAFIGRMTDQKRPDLAIEIAMRAGLEIRLAGTVDVGHPGYFDMRVRPRLGDRAHYVGPLGDKAKGELLSDAAALVFPIDWPEPFGLVMIEAMACGTPVIAMRRGSVPEIVEDGLTGFVVDTVEEAVVAVEKARRLDRAAVRRRFEERFTSQRMARDYVAIYRGLVGRT